MRRKGEGMEAVLGTLNSMDEPVHPGGPVSAAHGLFNFGKLVGPNGSGGFGAELVTRCRDRGYVDMVRCAHKTGAWDIILTEKGKEVLKELAEGSRRTHEL